MKKAILGKKIGMTQIFVSDGRLVPVTVVVAGPCTVTQVKTQKTDGYEAVQVGFDELSEQRAKKLLNKPSGPRNCSTSPSKVTSPRPASSPPGT